MKLLIVDDQASARRVLAAIVGKLDDVEIEEADSLDARAPRDRRRGRSMSR